jgi:hypothetical protein
MSCQCKTHPAGKVVDKKKLEKIIPKTGNTKFFHVPLKYCPPCLKQTLTDNASTKHQCALCDTWVFYSISSNKYFEGKEYFFCGRCMKSGTERKKEMELQDLCFRESQSEQREAVIHNICQAHQRTKAMIGIYDADVLNKAEDILKLVFRDPTHAQVEEMTKLIPGNVLIKIAQLYDLFEKRDVSLIIKVLVLIQDIPPPTGTFTIKCISSGKTIYSSRRRVYR